MLVYLGGLNCCYWPCCSLTSLGKFPPSIPAWWRATRDESDDSSAERKGGKQKINASAVTALFMCKTLEKLVTRLQGCKVLELQSASSRRKRKKKREQNTWSYLDDLKCRTINRHRFQSYSRDSDGYVLVNPTDYFLTCGGSLEMRHSRSQQKPSRWETTESQLKVCTRRNRQPRWSNSSQTWIHFIV